LYEKEREQEPVRSGTEPVDAGNEEEKELKTLLEDALAEKEAAKREQDEKTAAAQKQEELEERIRGEAVQRYRKRTLSSASAGAATAAPAADADAGRKSPSLASEPGTPPLRPRSATPSSSSGKRQMEESVAFYFKMKAERADGEFALARRKLELQEKALTSMQQLNKELTEEQRRRDEALRADLQEQTRLMQADQQQRDDKLRAELQASNQVMMAMMQRIMDRMDGMQKQ